jgi:hypothetical protein
MVSRLVYAQYLGDSNDNQVRRADWGQGDEVDAIGEIIKQVGSDLEGQASFANPTWPGEGEQTNLRLK